MCVGKKFIWIILICVLLTGLITSIASAASVDITVTARPSWTSVFTVTYVNDTRIKIEWTVPETSNVTIMAKYSEYPEEPTPGSAPTDGYLVFTGNGTGVSYLVYDTSMNLDLYLDKLYYRAWGYTYTGGAIVYGKYFGQDYVEGKGMTLLANTMMNIFAAIAVFGAVIVFSVLAFWKENHVIFMITAGVSMIAGLYAPDLINGAYVTTNYGIVVGLVLIAWGFLCCGFTFRLMFWSED